MLDNPAAFLSPLQFEVQFECLQALEEGEDGVAMPIYSLTVIGRLGVEAYLRWQCGRQRQ